MGGTRWRSSGPEFVAKKAFVASVCPLRKTAAMRSLTNSALLSWLLVASALAAGCSTSEPLVGSSDAQPETSTPTPDSESPDSTLPDSEVPDSSPPDSESPDSTASDGGVKVWLDGSTGFELTVSGGLPNPGDAGLCTGFTETWKYDVASRKITRTGCYRSAPVDAAVVLTPASAAELITHISSLMAEHATSSCGADAPDEVLTVLGPASTRRSFSSDFYSGCDSGPPYSDVVAPFIDDIALSLFQDFVDGYFAACNSVDGGPPDTTRATCVTGVGDAGVPDASDGG
jgi:hypothetical protein